MSPENGWNNAITKSQLVSGGIVRCSSNGIPVPDGDLSFESHQSAVEQRFIKLLKQAWQHRRLTNGGVMHEHLEKLIGERYGGRECVLFANTSFALMLFLARCRTIRKSSAEQQNQRGFVRVTDSVTRRQLVAIDWSGNVAVDSVAVDLDEDVPRDNTVATLLNPDDMKDGRFIAGDGNGDRNGDRNIISRLPILIDYSSCKMPIRVPKQADAVLLDPGSDNAFSGFHAACILVDDDSLARELRCQRNFGFNRTTITSSPATLAPIARSDFNAKLNEIHAAMALANLEVSESHHDATSVHTDLTLKHVGQINLPAWPLVSRAMRKTLRCRQVRKSESVVQDFEHQLARFLDVEHVICTANCTTALAVLLRAMDLKGEVIVPSFTFPATVQAVEWAGLTPRYCDIELATHAISARLARPLINPATTAILGMHCWGRPCDPDSLESLCLDHGLKLVFDAAHGLGCKIENQSICNYGIASAFSFHATKIVNCAEGGCVATNDANLADRMRATVIGQRPIETFQRGCGFQPQQPRRLRLEAPVTARTDPPPVFQGTNDGMDKTDRAVAFDVGMSPAQAVLGQLSLEDFNRNRERNRWQYELYRDELEDASGVTFFDYARHFDSTCQQIVLTIDDENATEFREGLFEELRGHQVLAKRYYWPGVHRLNRSAGSEPCAQLPNTEQLCERIFQLPSGSGVSREDIVRISEIVSHFCCQKVRDC